MEEVRQGKGLDSALNTRRILETVYGRTRAMNHQRMVVPLLRFVILSAIMTLLVQIWDERAKKQGPGGCARRSGVFHQIVWSVLFRSSGLCLGPAVLSTLTLPPPLIHLSPLTILSPICLPVML